MNWLPLTKDTPRDCGKWYLLYDRGAYYLAMWMGACCDPGSGWAIENGGVCQDDEFQFIAEVTKP